MTATAVKTFAVVLALATTSALGAANGTPFEQTRFDRGVGNERSQPASGGASVANPSPLASGAWAKDHNFISPSQ